MRVSIVPATIDLLYLEERDVALLCRELDTGSPVEWPPEFNGQPYRDWQRSLLARWPQEPGYAGYYIVADGELVGTCGFKGPPDEAGIVEMGYSVIEARRRRGYASAAVTLLVAHAFTDPRVTRILAETLPGAAPSQGVLLRCGFEPASTRIDPEDGEVVRFERRGPD